MTGAITSKNTGLRNAFFMVLTTLKGMASRPSGVVGLVLIGFHIFLAIMSPAIVPYDFKETLSSIFLVLPSYSICSRK
jgi:hypothetical protein